MRLDKTDLSFIMGRKEKYFSDDLVGALNDTIFRYSIGTPLRASHFLAQVGHESGGFRYNEEIASGEAYEGRADLGNTEPRDGRRFKGRGYIQLTGRTNYTNYSAFVGVDLVAEPHLVSTPSFATDVAGWFWQQAGLNEMADTDDVYAVTKKVNGGQNGIDHRIEILVRAKALLLGRMRRPATGGVAGIPVTSAEPPTSLEKYEWEPPRESGYLFGSKPIWASKRIWGVALTTLGLFGTEVGFLKDLLGEYDNIIQAAGLMLAIYGSVVAKRRLRLWPAKK